MKITTAAVAACSLLGAASAYAMLGAAPAPVGTGTVQATGAPSSAVTYAIPSGTVVTEYESASGVVFAVSWEGPSVPDMKALLGANFTRFEQAQRVHRGGPHAPARVAATDLQVISAGHPGAFRGAAWLPQLVPAGFDTGKLL